MSKRERSLVDRDADDLACELLERLKLVDDDSQVADLFVQVMQCPLEEATFFLDSACGDISRAVDLCLSYRSEGRAALKPHRRFREAMDICIDGLPPQWKALVTTSGFVRLQHQDSEELLAEVPTEVETVLANAGVTDLPSDLADKVALLQELVSVSRREAFFCLESCGWSLEVASELYEDNRASFMGTEIDIQGLPESWAAFVSKDSSRVCFVHQVSGHTQTDVPNGFLEDTDSTAAVDGGEGLPSDEDDTEIIPPLMPEGS
jgi:hypothetical protein